MQILIVGEMSGFAKHLKIGFERIGHSVTIVQHGDGWKKLAGKDDIICRNKSWYIKGHHIYGSNRIRAIFTNLSVDMQLRKQCPHPGLIIVINYDFLRENITDAGVGRRFLKKQINKGAKLIMTECGFSPAGMFRMPEFYKKKNVRIKLDDSRYWFLLNKSNVIIPTCYSYYDCLAAYREYFRYDVSKLHNCIPLPITIEENCCITPCTGRKIVVFHGIIRPIEKGTPFIQAAMEKLQSDFPDRVECVCVGGLPYNEYVELFERVDILVDQTYHNGWGMNAIIGAMKGKCVLAPCGPENSENMSIPEIPFVRIGPDSEQIYRTLRSLILNPESIDSIKVASRKFVVEYCDSKIIAQRYLSAVNL